MWVIFEKDPQSHRSLFKKTHKVTHREGHVVGLVDTSLFVGIGVF
jgi:hypothetical protein